MEVRRQAKKKRVGNEGGVEDTRAGAGEGFERGSEAQTTCPHLVTNKPVSSCLWLKVPYHQAGVHGAGGCGRAHVYTPPSCLTSTRGRRTLIINSSVRTNLAASYWD